MIIYIYDYIYTHICVMNINSEQTVLGFLDFVVFYGVNSQRLQLVPAGRNCRFLVDPVPREKIDPKMRKHAKDRDKTYGI